MVTSTHKILSYTFIYIYIYAPSIPGQETPVVPSADAVEPAEAAEGDIYIYIQGYDLIKTPSFI